MLRGARPRLFENQETQKMKTENTHTPAGFTPIAPTKMKLAAWAEMPYDAKIERHGITWYRCQGGMGQQGDREDWVADVPFDSISVHDYYWNGDSFGANHGTFENAIIQEMKFCASYSGRQIEELEARLVQSKRSREIVLAAIAKATKEGK